MTSEVPLSNGQMALVDARFYDAVREAGPWHRHPKGYAYAYIVGSKCGRCRQKNILMHRFVYELAGFVLPRRIDHRDRNKLHNAIDNLRPATNSQNNLNRPRQTNNQCGYKGVTRHEGKWRARITIEGVKHYLGRFETAERAAAAYDAAARRLCKEFACTNFEG